MSGSNAAGTRSERQLWIDMHPHLFNAADVPVYGFVKNAFLSSWPRPAAAVVAAGASLLASLAPRADSEIADLQRLIDAATTRTAIAPRARRRARDFLGMVATTLHRRLHLIRLLDSTCAHAIGDPDERPIDVYVPLGVDFEPAVGNPRSQRVSKQFDVTEKLSEAALHGVLGGGVNAIILPIVGFDPRRDAADPINGLRELQKRVCSGRAVGVKLYPPMGFHPIDGANSSCVNDSLRALYRFCNDERVPLVAHCSPNNAICPKEERARPCGWEPVVNEFTELKLCLAHAGGMGEERRNSGWFDEATEFISQHRDRVWCDIANHDFKRSGLIDRVIGRVKELDIGSQIMFGTDFWFFLMHAGAAEFVSEYAASFHKHVEPHYRDFTGLSARRFLGFDDPTNPNRRRVETWANTTLNGRPRPPALDRLLAPPTG